MEQALIRSETVADIAPVSNITSSWSSNDSLSGWIVSPSSTSDETQPRALRSSSQSMYYHDSSYHVPSFSIPGEGTDLSGSQVMSESYSLADTRLDHNLAHYNAKHDEKHDSSYLHSTPSDDHYGDTHYSYHPSTRTQILHHRSNHVQPDIYNHTNGWAHSPVMTSTSQQATTTFPYSDTREGNSPFLSSEPSPTDYTHQRMPSFPDSNHSNDMYPTMPLLSPLHPSIHGGNDHHYSSDFLHEQHTPKQFVNMSDIAGLHGAPGSDFGSDYAHCQISPADPGPDGTISLTSLDDAEEYAEGVMNDRKRKRTGSDADDEGAGDSEAGESIHSFSSLSSKRARVDSGGSRGRARKSTTSTQLSLTVVGSPEETRPFIPDAEPEVDFSHAIDEYEDEFDGDEGAYDDDDGDDDSDVYVPSRSASPRGRRVSRASSNDSSGQRRGIRGPGSAAQALKLMESTAIGYRPSPDDSTSGDISLDSYTHSKSSKPMPVPNLTKKSRGRKVPVHTSNSSESSHGRVQYGVGAGVTGNGYHQSNRLGLETSDMSSFYQHPTQYTHQQTSEGSSNGISVAPQHGRPAKEKYSSSSRPGGENESSDYGPGAKVVSGGVKKANGDRRYVCTAEGCGKCFVRGEHLKRHVRSLHTWDKPHKCPHPGCNKSFSRRDNLGQHVRVHM